MTAITTCVPDYHVDLAWSDLWPLVKPAYDLSPDKDDLLGGLRSRRFQLWAICSNDAPIAGIVTRLNRVWTSGDPKLSELHCHVWLIGGSRMSEWSQDFVQKITPWAKAEGCCAITGNGRLGWSRLMRRLGFRRVEDLQGMPCWRIDI